MNRIVNVLAILCVISLVVYPLTVFGQDGDDGNTILSETTELLMISDVPDSVAWEAATAMPLGQYYDKTEGAVDQPEDFQAEWKGYWSAEGLFVWVQVQDPTIGNQPAAADRLELYLDVNGSAVGQPDNMTVWPPQYDGVDDYQLQFAVSGEGSVTPQLGVANTDANQPGGPLDLVGPVSGEVIAYDPAQGYTMVIELPWSSISPDLGTPAVGHTLSFNVDVTVYPEEGERIGKLAWSNTEDMAWSNLVNAGEVTLIDADTAMSAPQTPPDDYRQLLPIRVFHDELLGTWSCNVPDCDLSAPDNLVPIDDSPEAMYNDLPSLRLEIREQTSGWWLVILAGPGWTTRSIANHAPNGFLEFNVKGTVGGEEFLVKLTDVVPGREEIESSLQINIADYVTVSTEWQPVAIPLSDFGFDENPDFNLDQVRDVRFEESYSGEYAKTFWVNDIRFTSPDLEPAFPAIKVNQVGYPEDAEKYAFVTGFAEDLPADLAAGAPFSVVSAADDTVVFTGELELVTEYDPLVSGETVFSADFSEVTTPGDYYLEVETTGLLDGGNTSLTFTISNDVYDDMLVDVARYFYYQRQGIELPEEYAGQFARELGHPQDANAPLRSVMESGAEDVETLDVSQGWYDAGDYGKYVAYAAPAVDDLLAVYESYPDVFTDSQFNIPESGNGVPDLLDELRWELDWVLKMQDPNDGGFYERIYPNNADGMPHEHEETRYVEDLLDGTTPNVKPTRATAVAVAYLAHAARVYRPFDAEYADELLAAARAGWDYLRAYPECWPSTWWTCEPDSQWNTEGQNRLWAAAELFHTTGEDEFNEYFLSHYSEDEFRQMWLNTDENAGFPGMRAFLAYASAPNADPDAKAWFVEHFNSWREDQLSRTETFVWRNFLNDGSDGKDSDYYWGSNSVTLETISTLARGSMIAGNYDDRIIRAAHAQLNYILGINPLQLSYVSGHGANSIETIYSHIYSNDEIDAIPAGYMAEGPNQYNGGLAYSRFYGKAFRATNSDWTTSEHAIYYNAHLLFVTALVVDEAE